MKCAREWLWCGCIVVAAASMLGVGGAGMLQPRTGTGGGKPADSVITPPSPLDDNATAAGLTRDELTRLDLAMQQAIANKEVAGVVGLVFRNGRRGYFEAFGLKDMEASTPMTKDAIFRLQSMSKPVVTVAALTLLDERKFTLDEPISKHLPEWAEPKVLEDGKLVPARHAITPRMLMSHSSGLYYGNLPGAAAGGGVTRDARTTLESYSKDLAARPLKFHPGEGYSYGTSIDVLGRYVEAVAGKPLDEVLKERVLFPLKMSDTDFWVPQEKASRIAQLYRQVQPGELARGREASQLTTKPSLFMGGQGLCSTAEDYERFCRMILNRGELDGVRVLKPETVDLMFENHIKAGGQRYGLGGAVDERGGYAWGGANGTQFWIDRTNKMFAVFMVQTQRYRAPTYNTFRRLVNEAAGVSGRGFDGPMGDQPGGEAPAAPAPGGGRLRQVFDRLDADSDGSLSKDEYAKSTMADRVDFATADADGNGSVSYQEAMAALRRR
jgi:CubicO group peptidase (beta-lactamase class C family)